MKIIIVVEQASVPESLVGSCLLYNPYMRMHVNSQALQMVGHPTPMPIDDIGDGVILGTFTLGPFHEPLVFYSITCTI